MSIFKVLTGAEFNTKMAGTKLCKVLNWNLIHYNFGYVPGALNQLNPNREKFDPNPHHMPGGLYFCTESDILRWISLANHPMIASIEIPDNAQISIGEHQFKTDMLILGVPITFEEFCLTDAVRNLSIEVVKVPCPFYSSEWYAIKKVYMHASDKFGPARRAKLLHNAIGNCDINFFDVLMQNNDVQKMLEDPQIRIELDELSNRYSDFRMRVQNFESRYPQHADLIRKVCN